MIKHTRDVAIVALTQWMFANQDDTGCLEAADTLGNLGAVTALLEMLGGPLTPRCAASVATAISVHGDTNLLPDLCRLRVEFDAAALMLNHAIDKIVEDGGECTCSDCGGPLEDDEDLVSGGTIRPVTPPDDQHPHLRN